MQPTDKKTFSVQKANHVGFTVPSLERAIEFWVGVLGLEAGEEMRFGGSSLENIVGVPGAATRLVFVHAPGLDIELVEYTSPADRNEFNLRPCDVGSAHLCLNVDDIRAVQAAAAKLDWRSAGEVQTHERGEFKGVQSVFLHSPEGIQLELMQWPSNS